MEFVEKEKTWEREVRELEKNEDATRNLREYINAFRRELAAF